MSIWDDISKGATNAWKGFTDFIPGVGDAKAQDKANEQNIQLTEQNRDWMEKMSNTAYQRAMDDMKKAGLNPMLAYQQGGASVPSSAAATVSPSAKTGAAHAALSAFTGIQASRAQHQTVATQAAQAQSSINLQNAQTAKEVAQTDVAAAEAALKKRELRGKGVKETIDRKGGEVIQKLFDSLTKSTAKPLPAIKLTPEQRKHIYKKFPSSKPKVPKPH